MAHFASFGMILLVITIVRGSMIVETPSELAGEYLSVGYFLVGKQGHWMINGSLLAMNEDYGCSVDNLNLAGKIAVVTKQGTFS
jgi:hypothetical protein